MNNKQKTIDYLNQLIRDQHHNARLDYPYNLMDALAAVDERDDIYNLISEWASFEIQWMNDMCGYTKKEIYPTRKALRSKKPDNNDCILVARLTNEQGKLYTWGRSGATLMPDRLIEPRGGSSYAFKQFECDDISHEDATELIQQLHAFNRFVESWCSEKNLSYMLKEELQTRYADLKGDISITRKGILSLIKDIKKLGIRDKSNKAYAVLHDKICSELQELRNYQKRAAIAFKAI